MKKLCCVLHLHKIGVILLLVFAYTIANAQSPHWLWAKSSTGGDAGFGGNNHSICTDRNGNVFITGRFQSPTITFGSITLTRWPGWNMFIAKYDAAGNVLWAKGANGGSNHQGTSVRTDENGNAFVTGSFNSQKIIFGSDTLKNPGGETMFLVKYDPSGNVLWARSSIVGLSSTPNASGQGVDIDGSGNVWVTGWFQSPTITFGSTTLTNAGIFNVFIVKYDASGNVLWAKSAGGSSGDRGSAISMDGSGNALITGFFTSPTITFGSTSLTNPTPHFVTMFVAKYDPSGNVLWAKNSGGGTSVYGTGVSTDSSSNVFVTGYFSCPPCISFGSITLIGGGMFLVKYDPDGNVLWAKNPDGGGGGQGFSSSTDRSGNVFVTGYFGNSKLIFGSTTLYDGGMFVVKYDPDGNALWAKKAGKRDADQGHGVSTDDCGNAFVTGGFSSKNIDFGSDTLTNAGSGFIDVFIAKVDFAYITGKTKICTGQTTTLTASGGTSYSWSTGQTTSSITVSPTATTNYAVTASTGTCVGTATVTVTVVLPPTATFISSPVCLGNTTTLTGSSVSPINDSITSWSWTMPGGNPASAITSTATTFYLTAGMHPVTLVVTTEVGCKDTMEQQVLVYTPPVANFSSSQNTNGFSFNDSSTSTDGSITSWDWFFPGGTPSTSTLQNPVNILYPSGAHNACLMVTSTYGCKDTDCNTIVVTSVNENYIEDNFNIFPNPANGVFTIQNNNQQPTATMQLEIYNVLGEKVYSAATSGRSSTISLNVPNGIYRMQIKTDHGIATTKIIISK